MGRLSIVVLFTPEIARQQEFYEKSLGMSAAAASPRWVQFGTRDAALALRALAAGAAPRIELGFDVPSLDERLRRLAARGVEPVAPLEESADCRIARVADPDGNIVQLVERKKPTVAGNWPRLSQGIVNAQAFEACVHFYHDVLGFKMSDEREHWVEFDTGEANLTLHAWRDADGLPIAPDQPVTFALMDDDLDAWADELRERGVRFATVPTEAELGRMAEVEDADGWFVVLRGPAAELPFEEELAEDYAGEDDTRVEQIRKSGDLDPGARPGFGSRKLARKKVERVATKGYEALQKTRDADRGGFTPSTPGASRPFTPRPPRPDGAPPRPYTPRPDGAPRPDRGPGMGGPRPPRPDGAPPRPYTPRPAGPGGPRPSGPRPFPPRGDGPRPSGPRREGGGPPRSGGPPRGPRRDD